MPWSQSGSLRARLIAYVVITVGILTVIFLRVGFENARARDIQRLADALTIRSAFEKLFLHDRSYAAAADDGCNKIDISVRRCSLVAYYRDISTLVDPGKHDYVVTQVPSDTNYEVSFWLELNHAGFAKGKHTISADGIK